MASPPLTYATVFYFTALLSLSYSTEGERNRDRCGGGDASRVCTIVEREASLYSSGLSPSTLLYRSLFYFTALLSLSYCTERERDREGACVCQGEMEGKRQGEQE